MTTKKADDRPQIYVYLTSGGILEWVVTRGDIDVIDVDWDEGMERTVEDWREVRERLSLLADSKLRDSEIASVDDEINELLGWEQARKEREERERKARVEEALEIIANDGRIGE